MKLFETTEYDICQALLSDGNWQKTDYYELSSESSLCSAVFIALEKKVTDIPRNAIIYLLERFAAEDGNWGELLASEMNFDFLRKAILSNSYVANEKGWEITPHHFWVFFEQATDVFFRELLSFDKKWKPNPRGKAFK